MEEEYEKRKYAYVVEGVTDEDKLKKAGVTYIIKTGGLFIQSDILNLIRMTSKVRKIVMLTDPDGPGKKIRQLVEKELDQGSWIDLDVSKAKARDNKKVGIAQMKMKDLIDAIFPYLIHDSNSKETPLYQIYDLYEMKLAGFDSAKNKSNFERNLGIHIPSSKTLCSYLNMLMLNREEIEELKEEK